jgi:hypothetical protein
MARSLIKRDWDWLEIWPQSNSQIYGMVEIPALGEILTTNKNDFLRDTSSLKKHYKYRKVIQEAVLPILAELGEEKPSFESDLKRLRPLEKVVEKTLRYLLNNFPELIPLVGVRRSRGTMGISSQITEPLVGIIPEGEKQKLKEEIIEKKEKSLKEKKEKEERKNEPGLTIRFEGNPSPKELGRMVKNTIWVNTNHPAYQKAKKERSEEYHILLCVAWVLSRFIEEGSSPQEFISQFLASWGGGDKKTLQIF